MCVCVVFMYLSEFSLFNETFLDGHFLLLYKHATGESIVAAPPDPFIKTKFVFFLFAGFALKISAAFTTRSLVEQLLPILFVFFFRQIAFIFRNYHFLFVSLYLHTFLYGGGRKFRTISFLVDGSTPQHKTHIIRIHLLIRDRLVSTATVFLFCCYCNSYPLNC